MYRTPAPLGRISAASAAVVERSWRGREAEVSRRQRNAEWLLGQGIEGVIAPIAGAVGGWLRLPVLARSREQVADQSLGAWRSYPIPLPSLPELNRAAPPGSEFPGAVTLAERLWTLPTHSMVSESIRSRLAAMARATFSA